MNVFYAIVLLLSHKDYTVRYKAQHVLEQWYPLSVPACIYGTKSLDPEIQDRCKKVLEPLAEHVAFVEAFKVIYLMEEWDVDRPYTSYVNNYTAFNQYLLCRAIKYLTGRDYYQDTYMEYDALRNHIHYARVRVRHGEYVD